MTSKEERVEFDHGDCYITGTSRDYIKEHFPEIYEKMNDKKIPSSEEATCCVKNAVKSQNIKFIHWWAFKGRGFIRYNEILEWSFETQDLEYMKWIFHFMERYEVKKQKLELLLKKIDQLEMNPNLQSICNWIKEELTLFNKYETMT